MAGRLALFCLPFALVLAAAGGLMLLAGEFDSISGVITLQSRGDRQVLFGRAYSDPTAYYKLTSTIERRPTVLVLGTSRVMAIRSNAFRKDVPFYNAGNGVTRLGHFRKFLSRIPAGQEPRVIVLGLDQFLFNKNFDSLEEDGIEELWSGDRRPQDIFFGSWIDVYRDFFQRKFELRHLAATPGIERVGLNASVYGNGFRNDGSYTWAQYVADPWNPNNDDYQFHNTLDRIAKGDRRFQYGAHVSQEALAELDAFLEDCTTRGIHVVTFLPPYAHQIYEAMMSRPENYGYLRELPDALRAVFARHTYSLHDFSDLAWLRASDRETIDGFHGSEKAYLRLLLRLIEADETLRTYTVDAASLRQRIDGSASDHLVFDINER
jgi:hypothetical protein